MLRGLRFAHYLCTDKVVVDDDVVVPVNDGVGGHDVVEDPAIAMQSHV